MSEQASIRAVAIALLATVASQIFYITVVSGSENEMLRPLTWFAELIAFLVLATVSFALGMRRPDHAVLWTLVGISGLLNMLQVAMGLSMFAPAMKVSESLPELFEAVLAGAFFLYFLAKFTLGAAAVMLGLSLFGKGGAVTKAVGATCALSGLAALGLNLVAMASRADWTFLAGGAGTLVAAAFAAALLVEGRGAAATQPS